MVEGADYAWRTLGGKSPARPPSKWMTTMLNYGVQKNSLNVTRRRDAGRMSWALIDWDSHVMLHMKVWGLSGEGRMTSEHRPDSMWMMQALFRMQNKMLGTGEYRTGSRINGEMLGVSMILSIPENFVF